MLQPPPPLASANHPNDDPPPSAGPPPPKQWVTLESKNITSLASYFAGLANRTADITCMQGHCCSLPVLQRLGAELAQMHGRVMVAGPPDPNLEQAAAGVATIGRSTDTVLCLDARAESLSIAQSLGRAQLIGFGKGKAAGLINIYNAYGHSGRHSVLLPDFIIDSSACSACGKRDP